MKKRLVTFGIGLLGILLILAVYYLSIHNYSKLSPELSEELIIKSFESSGANYINSEISFEVSLSEECQNEECLNKLMIELGCQLGMDLINENITSNLEITENDYMYKLDVNNIEKHEENISLCGKLLKLQGNLDTTKGKKYESGDIALLIEGKDSCKKFQVRKKEIENILENYNLGRPKYSCFIAGNIDGELDNDLINKICKDVFYATNAKKVEGIFKNGFTSVSAFSP